MIHSSGVAQTTHEEMRTQTSNSLIQNFLLVCFVWVVPCRWLGIWVGFEVEYLCWFLLHLWVGLRLWFYPQISFQEVLESALPQRRFTQSLCSFEMASWSLGWPLISPPLSFHLPSAGITGSCPSCPASSCSYLAQSTHKGPGCWVFKFSVRPALTAASRLPLCSPVWAFFLLEASDRTFATLLNHLWRAWLVFQQQISMNIVNILTLQNACLPPVTLMNLTVKSCWRNSSWRLRRIWLGG